MPVGWEGILGKGERRIGGGEAGMEKLRTDEAGSKGLGVEAAAPASQDFNGLLIMGVSDTGTAASVGVGSSDKFSLEFAATGDM